MRGPLPLLALLCSLHTCSDAADWCYSSQKQAHPDCAEPCRWGTENNTCDGIEQSPIGISTKNAEFNESLKPFSFQGYDQTQAMQIQNNGHTVLGNLSLESKISGGGLPRSFRASQFHLHWGDGVYGGSEHLIDSVRYPAELHIVHQTEAGSDGAQPDKFQYAVLAFFYKEVPENNTEYESLIAALPEIKHKDSTAKIDNIKLKNLIPSAEKLNRYFRYNGSLTTPGCDQSVIWTVFEEEIGLSKTQIGAFSKNLYFPDRKTNMRNNYRPMQELHGRLVQRASASTHLLQGATIFITSAFVYLVIGLQH